MLGNAGRCFGEFRGQQPLKEKHPLAPIPLLDWKLVEMFLRNMRRIWRHVKNCGFSETSKSLPPAGWDNYMQEAEITQHSLESGPSGSKPSGLLEFRVAPWIPGENSASG